jgi:hypothetical protein
VDKFFFPRHSPNWLVVQYFQSHFQVRKQLAKNKGSVIGEKKQLARLASGFVFLLASPEFYSHLASWRVIMCTPDVRDRKEEVVKSSQP